MKYIKLLIYFFCLVALGSCKKYLDVVPDNVATIENAFSSRTTAEKFLFTCYSYMPSHASPNEFMMGDEMWLPFPQMSQFYYNGAYEVIARDNQGVTAPTMNYWDGESGGKPLYQGLRDCNIFLENMDAVPGMQEFEKKKWIAEVKFLKAYYHYWLVRMYGPIPLVRVNLPISANVNEVQVKRDPVDSCFNYIVSLLDEAVVDLPLRIENESSEMGRISKMIALSVKAQVLAEAASPLFNGNSDYASFKNRDGEQLFSATADPEKWKKAMDAAKEAIDACAEVGLSLYRYMPLVNTYQLSDTTLTQMSIRNSITEKWNQEVIWGNTNSMAWELQNLSQARIDPSRTANLGTRSMLAPTLKMAELFYTANGVPISEDLNWDYANRYTTRTATAADRFNIEPGYETAVLHFDRENRFYADLAFDGGVWYGQGRYDDKNPWTVKAKLKQPAGRIAVSLFSVTGYWPKKLVHFQNIIEAGDGGPYTVTAYPWPVLRLAELYLMYAEAINEFASPAEAYPWINLVRERAGLPTVEESWTNHSRFATKHTTREGLRSIIQQERQIETAFEGKRFWDLRRWKLARQVLNNENIQGWDVEQEDTQLYYRVRTLFTKQFNSSDYFWPIKEDNLIRNRNLVQNPGW